VLERHLILNRVQDSVSQEVENAIQEEGLTLLSSIPDDKQLLEMDQKGKTIDSLADDSPVYKALDQMLTKLLNIEETRKAK